MKRIYGNMGKRKKRKLRPQPQGKRGRSRTKKKEKGSLQMFCSGPFSRKLENRAARGRTRKRKQRALWAAFIL